MNEMHFQQVWFADEKRNLSATKMVVFSDRGCLEVKPDRLIFKGKKSELQISNIKDVSLVRQRINWVAYLIMNLVLVAYFAWLIKDTPDIFSWPFLMVMLLIGDIFGVIVGYNTKWVRVEYSDGNRDNRAFFADSSSLGWGGIFGGTENMDKMLLATMKNK